MGMVRYQSWGCESRRDVIFVSFWHETVLIKDACQILADVGTGPLFFGIPELGPVVIAIKIQTALDGLNDTERSILAKLIRCLHVGALAASKLRPLRATSQCQPPLLLQLRAIDQEFAGYIGGQR
jgi:hypothetical protein